MDFTPTAQTEIRALTWRFVVNVPNNCGAMAKINEREMIFGQRFQIETLRCDAP